MLDLIARKKNIFIDDINKYDDTLKKIISMSSFLVLGGAGTIGQAVTKEIFKRNPKKLHIVDISENNLVELVRDIRSSFGYIKGEFKTFALDIGSSEYDYFFESDGKYDFVLNLSALKHVRSEKDHYTLMRMINVNILNTVKTIQQCANNQIKKYFCVSTDKAANPVNMMGASKKIMEMFVNRFSDDIVVSMARFANVAFSDGSLLYSFNKRLEKNQPIVAPNDIKRYFITEKEAGELCLMSCVFGDNRDIFFPKPSSQLTLNKFSDIAINFLQKKSIKPIICKTEDEARKISKNNLNNNEWPCFFTNSNTTGEKDFEEFFTDKEVLDMDKFNNIGVIKNKDDVNYEQLSIFVRSIKKLQKEQSWSKKDILNIFLKIMPEFKHKETGEYLDDKM